MLTAKGGPEITLVFYLMRSVTSQVWVQRKQRHSVVFLPVFNTSDRSWDLQSSVLEGCHWGNDKLPAHSELVQDLLLQLDVQKSMGPNKIHPRVLKVLADVIAGALSIILQQSWQPGEVPVNWKHGKYCPKFSRRVRRETRSGAGMCRRGGKKEAVAPVPARAGAVDCSVNGVELVGCDSLLASVPLLDS